MISPSLSKQKKSYHRKLRDTRYKKWLRKLSNHTSALRRSYDRKNPNEPEQIERDEIEYYRGVEMECLKAIRALIIPSESKITGLRDFPHTFTLESKVIDFNKYLLYTLERIEHGLHFEKIEELIEMLENINELDEIEYHDMRVILNHFFKTDAFPLLEDLPYDILVFIDNLELLNKAFRSYVEHFYKTYLHYKSKFEEAHELKRVLLGKSGINNAIVNNTLFVYSLVHGKISYQGDDLVMTEAPMIVYQMLQSRPGCVAFASGKERHMYDKMNLYIKRHLKQNPNQMIRGVIKDAVPMMTTINDKVKKKTLKKNQTVQYVKNYIQHHTYLPHLFHTQKEEMIHNKQYGFDLKINYLFDSKQNNLEGLKVIHSRNIEDAIDLMDYLKLTINENNEIMFTLSDIMEVLSEYDIDNLVILDSSCQASIHPPEKTYANFRRTHKRL